MRRDLLASVQPAPLSLVELTWSYRSLFSQDATGSNASSPVTPVILAIKKIKELFPQVLIAVDVCLCEYTSHGHCGVLDAEGLIDQEKSVKRRVRGRLFSVAREFGPNGGFKLTRLVSAFLFFAGSPKSLSTTLERELRLLLPVT